MFYDEDYGLMIMARRKASCVTGLSIHVLKASFYKDWARLVYY
jgi:hypothetical protein